MNRGRWSWLAVVFIGCGSALDEWIPQTRGVVERFETARFRANTSPQKQPDDGQWRSQCPTISATRITAGSAAMSLLEVRGTGLARITDVVATLESGASATVVCDVADLVLRCPLGQGAQTLYFGFVFEGLTGACVGPGYSFTVPR